MFFFVVFCPKFAQANSQKPNFVRRFVNTLVPVVYYIAESESQPGAGAGVTADEVTTGYHTGAEVETWESKMRTHFTSTPSKDLCVGKGKREQQCRRSDR